MESAVQAAATALPYIAPFLSIWNALHISKQKTDSVRERNAPFNDTPKSAYARSYNLRLSSFACDSKKENSVVREISEIREW